MNLIKSVCILTLLMFNGAHALLAPATVSCSLSDKNILLCSYDSSNFTLQPPPYEAKSGEYQFQYAETMRDDLFPIYYYQLGTVKLALFGRASVQATADLNSVYWHKNADRLIYRCEQPVSHCPFQTGR